MNDSQNIDELKLLVAEITKAIEKETALRLAEALESLEESKCNKCKVKVSPCLHYDPSDDED